MPLDRRTIRIVLATLEASEECVEAFRASLAPGEPVAALKAMEDLLAGSSPAVDFPADLPVKIAPVMAPAQTIHQLADMVRLPAENLDRLVRSTGQIFAESLRQESITAELEALDDEMAETAAVCTRFRRVSSARLRRLAALQEYSSLIRHIEFIEQKARSLAAHSKAARLLQQRSVWSTRRSADQLQRDLWSARMAPAEDSFEGFRKMVRDLARQENKDIDFRLSGSGVRADRIVLQALKDPVMHLLRNAISHGIETPAERAEKGKEPVASLTLRLDSERGRLIIEVDDDGRGIDLHKVAEVLGRTEPGTHSAEELAQAIFRPGFSTSAGVNRLSGRGMGLSVVYETVHRFQGDVTLRPKESSGACFVLSVPLSISSTHLLLLSCAGQTFGVPTHAIERLYRIGLDQVETMEEKPVVNLRGKPVPLYGLASLLEIGGSSPATSGEILPVMVLKSGARRFAVWVDEFLTERDAMMKELGVPCATGNISGGAFLRDGTVFMILNPAGLAATCAASVAARAPRRVAPDVQAIAHGILVVDDSITSRSLEKSILEAHGYRVRTAVDGLEALEMLRGETADLIVTDIQMPRLDGFGLVEALKADPKLNRIPVIIVSSLERTEDQERGLMLGADAYVVKRKFDQAELLDTIRQMI